MSGYRRVNYYELCRLCTSSEGTKMHIFREEGRRRQLPTKLQVCLPLQICETDALPKIICMHCADKLDSFYDFRESCVNAENMLETFFNSIRYSDDFQREGKVYVKDESPKKKEQVIVEPDILKPDESSENNTNPDASCGKSQLKIATVNPVLHPMTVETLPAIQIVSSSTISEQIFNEKTNTSKDPTSVTSLSEATFASFQNEALTINSPAKDMNNGRKRDATLCNNSDSLILAVQHCKSDDSTQTDFSESHEQPIKAEISQEGDNSGTNTTNDIAATSLQQAIALQSQEMLVQLGFTSKDKDSAPTLFRTEDVLNRSSMAQIGEFLRMKTVAVVESMESGDNSLQIAMCETCGKELSSAEELATHMVNCQPEPTVDAVDVQDEKTAYSCDECGSVFRRREHLNQHIKLHTGERPYSCSSCGKSFSRKEHLVRHSVSHTGQKVHECDMCGKSFSRKDNLHKHRKTHGIVGPYVCDLCGKSFVVKHYFVMHKSSHQQADSSSDDLLPYKCDICNKGFSLKHNLNSHKQRHRKNASRLAAQENVVSSNEQPQQQNGTSESSVPSALSTVNAAAILPTNILQTGSNVATTTLPTPLFQVTAPGGSTYLCTPASVTTNQILETYRRLNNSSSSSSS